MSMTDSGQTKTSTEGPADLSFEQRVETLKAQGIDTILCTFTDLLGSPKGKLVPVQALAQVVTHGAGFSGPSIWGTGLPRRGPRSEYMGRVQLETLKAWPLIDGIAQAFCDGYAGGEPLATCPRQVLRRQTQALAERGLRLAVGIEPEFFLFSRDANGQLTPADRHDRLAKPSYDLQSLLRQHEVLTALRRGLEDLGFELEQIDHEDACGQFEINYRHADALTAADQFQRFKLLAHGVAEAHGLVFSCMPKPYADQPGSGLHFHLSLIDADGRAVMADPQASMGLSALGHAVVAGLLHHADALAALCAPTVNSYKRLAVSDSASGTTWSPVWKAVGSNNRSTLVRAVAGRIEWRMPDPSCNVYLALAGVIAAALSGIDQGLPEVAATEVDLYEVHRQGGTTPARLPRDLRAALDALALDQPLQKALGHEICHEVLAYGAAHWDAWRQHVSAWEWQQYGDRA